MPRIVIWSNEDNLKSADSIQIKSIDRKRENVPTISSQKHSAAMRTFNQKLEKTGVLSRV